MRVPLLFALAISALGATIMSCGSDEEVAPVVTATPPTAVPTALLTPTESQSAAPTAQPDWVAYTQPASAKSDSFSLSYPGGWVLEGGETGSPGSGVVIILKSWPKGHPPAGAVKVDIFVDPLDAPALPCVFENATPGKLGSLAAWEPPPLPPEETEFPSGTIRRIIADHGGFRYCVDGYLWEGADKSLFQQIIDSFMVRDSEAQ